MLCKSGQDLVKLPSLCTISGTFRKAKGEIDSIKNNLNLAGTNAKTNCKNKSQDHKIHKLVQAMGGVFAKYSVQAVACLFSKKSGLFFGISRFKKIDTVS